MHPALEQKLFAANHQQWNPVDYLHQASQLGWRARINAICAADNEKKAQEAEKFTNPTLRAAASGAAILFRIESRKLKKQERVYRYRALFSLD